MSGQRSRLDWTVWSRQIFVTALLAMGAAFANAANIATIFPGELAVHSRYGEPLSLSIELGSIDSATLARLQVVIGSPTDYAARKIVRQPGIDQLLTALKVDAEGKVSLAITSKAAWREPTLNLLVRVGRSGEPVVSRLYTLASGETQPIESSALLAQADVGNALPETPPASVPAAVTAVPAEDFTALPRESALSSDSGPPATADAAASLPIASTAGNETAASGATDAAQRPSRIRTTAGDSASQIASQIRPASATLNQTMSALYKRNPHAFFGSIDQLKAGVELVVPDQVAILAEPRRVQLVRQVPLIDAKADRPDGSPSDKRAQRYSDTSEGGSRLNLSAGGVDLSDKASPLARGEAEVAVEMAKAETMSRLAQLETIQTDLNALLALRSEQIGALERQIDGAETKDVTEPSVAADGLSDAKPPTESLQPASLWRGYGQAALAGAVILVVGIACAMAFTRIETRRIKRAEPRRSQPLGSGHSASRKTRVPDERASSKSEEKVSISSAMVTERSAA